MQKNAVADQAEFRHLHDMLRYAIDEHAIVAITNLSGVITFINDKFCDISQYTRDELLGKTHQIVNSGHHPKSFFVKMWETIARGETWRGEVCNRAKDGSLYWVDTTIVPYVDSSGKVIQHIAIRTDITGRKQTEHELIQANRELEEFVYTASHDLKSPLLTIEGYSGHLQEYIKVGDIQNSQFCIQRISSAAVRMRSNIDDLLDLSKIGRVKLEMEALEMKPSIMAILYDLEEQVRSSDVKIVINESPPTIWGDPVRIRQLLINMISNAIKHGRPSDGEFVVTIGAENHNNMTKLFVSDNGQGIDEEYRSKVFELFQRLDTNVDGTGVGLNIVKRIAEVHGGSAWIDTTPGGGATVCVTLPTQNYEPEYQSNTQRKISNAS